MTIEINFENFKASYKTFLSTIPKIEKDSFSYFLGDNFYDGYLNGFLRYSGKLYAFEIVSDFKLNEKRIFAVTEATEIELESVLQKHKTSQEFIDANQDFLNGTGKLNSSWEIYFNEIEINEDFDMPNLLNKKVEYWFAE